MINNVAFGFLNYSTINESLYYVYGMVIGIETKIIVAFKDDRPLKNEEAKLLCSKIFNFYIED